MKIKNSKILHTSYFILHTSFAKGKSGAMTLVTVLVVSAVVMAIAVATLAVSSLFVSGTTSSKTGNQAFAIAEAGARDGILRVIKNCSIGSVNGTVCTNNNATSRSSPACPGGAPLSTSYIGNPYQVTVGTGIANVVIQDDQDCSGNKVIISTSTVLNATKRVLAIIAIDQATGKANTKSFGECYNYNGTTQSCL